MSPIRTILKKAKCFYTFFRKLPKIKSLSLEVSEIQIFFQKLASVTDISNESSLI